MQTNGGCADERGRMAAASAALRATMVKASLISRLSHAVDLIEKRSQHNRPWKVVKVRRGLKEDPDEARDRHFAAHPEDQDANVVIFEFFR